MKHILLAGMLICLLSPAFAKGKPNHRIILNGKTDNAQLTALRVRVFHPYYFIQRQNIDVSEYTVPIQQLQFQLACENISRMVYMHLFVQSSKGELFLGSFIAEPGDNIHIALADNRLLFSGKGSGKYNCMKTLRKNPFSISLGLVEPEKIEDYTAWLNRIALMKDSAYQRRITILEQYRKELSTDAYALLAAELKGEYSESLYGDIYFYLGFRLKSKAQYQQLFSRLQQLELTPPDTANGSVLSLSDKYTAYLFTRMKTLLYAQALNKERNEKPTIKELLRFTEQNLRGALRDKLTATIFYSNYLQEPEVLLQPGQFTRLISDAHLQSAIYATCSKKQKGAAAFPFALSDSSHQLHNLNIYKGKTLVLMIWVSGCPASEYLGAALRQFTENDIPKDEVVFITVNADKSRALWINSLQGSILLPQGAVHLFAGSQGSKEPMLQHYEVVSYPQLMVIDSKGSIISSSAPRPVTKEKTEALRRLLTDASRM